MARYYAYISGAANVSTNFNPYSTFTGNSNYLRLEYNGDITTDSIASVYVWRQQSGNWFSFEQGSFKHYMNLGSTTYVTQVNTVSSNRRDWNTNGFEKTAIFEINTTTVVLQFDDGSDIVGGTISGTFPNNTIMLFPSSYASNLSMNFYELKVYGINDTLLYDFVPYLSGTSKGILETLSGDFYAATDQSKMTLYSLKTFEISRTAVTADYMPATYILTLTADDDMTWTASTDSNWITLLDATGTGSHTFRLQFSKNEAYSVRNGIVTIINNYGDEIEIYVTQKKYPLFVPSENIYRADLEVVKGYRSGNTINKAYRNGKMILWRRNPPTE